MILFKYDCSNMIFLNSMNDFMFYILFFLILFLSSFYSHLSFDQSYTNILYKEFVILPQNGFLVHVFLCILLSPLSHILLNPLKGNWDKINTFLVNGHVINPGMNVPQFTQLFSYLWVSRLFPVVLLSQIMMQ